MKVVLSPRAGADLSRLHEFLERSSFPAAERAAATLAKRLNLLSQFPALGRPLGGTGMRDLYVPFGKSSYVIRYYLSERRKAVVIVRIWHAREQRQ